MAYIGKTPTIGNFQVCDAISVVNGQAAYTMQVGGVNVSPESANHMLVSLNGVIQKPTDAYTVSSSTITFASNLVTGDVIDFIQILGNVLDLGVPSDNTVSTAKIVDANVTTAKIADTSVTPAKLNLNDNLLFNTASKGIYLGVTSATASNLLDDYEEGTWTPTASQGSVSHVAGGYIKIGRLVTLTIDLSNFTNTTSTDFIQINGIPFAVDSSENMATGAMFGERIDTNNNGNSVQAVLTTSSTGILFFNGVGSTNFAQLKYTDINDGTDCAIRGTITYLAAS